MTAVLVPPGVVTVRFTGPAVPTGAVTVSDVGPETTTPVPGVLPKLTLVAPITKPEPVTVTTLVPATGPAVGDNVVTAGTTS